MENRDQSIFPKEVKGNYDINGDRLLADYVTPGLTKREYFAGLAMQGILANNIVFFGDDPKGLARAALICADELLTQLNK